MPEAREAVGPRGRRWAIVLAGGAGARLSELTRTPDGATVPKQYCSLLGGASLLGAALARAASLVGRERVVAVVAPEHRPYWTRQLACLPPGNTIQQPANRGTAPGILLPLLSILERDPLATVALLPADHYFARERIVRRSLQRALRFAESDPRGRLAVLGIAPDRAETQYGWIVPAVPTGRIPLAGPLPVSAFVEKPDRERAEELRARGGMWNSFLVAARGAVLLDLFAQRAPGLVPAFLDALFVQPEEREQRLARLYAELEPKDFCRDLLEGSEERLCVSVVPPCGWTDLGDPERGAECIDRHGRGFADADFASDAPLVLARQLAALRPREAPIVRGVFARAKAFGPRATRPLHFLGSRAGGTGSLPPRTSGLQRSTRHSASNVPRTTPCASIASIAYWLHVGLKRHIGGFSGER